MTDINPESGPLLDGRAWEEFASLWDTPEEVRDLVEEFILDAEVHVAAIMGATAPPDCPAVERSAHTLKSSSANLGAARLSAICEQLQRAARAGEDEALGPLCAALPETMTATAARLRQACEH